VLFAAYRYSTIRTGHHVEDVVVPVPLGNDRLRSRGFNQAYLLVHKWQHIGRREAIDVPEPLDKALIKVRRTRPQTGLDREMRLKNVRNAFRVNRKVKLEERTVLLVDDVFTTGATLAACTEALLAGGAAGVNVLTLARKLW
jgi:ComF family protein